MYHTRSRTETERGRGGEAMLVEPKEMLVEGGIRTHMKADGCTAGSRGSEGNMR